MIFKDFTGGDVGKRFDTSNYDKVEKSLLIGESKKGVGLMKYEFGGKKMKKFAGLRRKTCNS